MNPQVVSNSACVLEVGLKLNLFIFMVAELKLKTMYCLITVWRSKSIYNLLYFRGYRNRNLLGMNYNRDIPNSLIKLLNLIFARIINMRFN